VDTFMKRCISRDSAAAFSISDFSRGTPSSSARRHQPSRRPTHAISSPLVTTGSLVAATRPLFLFFSGGGGGRTHRIVASAHKDVLQRLAHGASGLLGDEVEAPWVGLILHEHLPLSRVLAEHARCKSKENGTASSVPSVFVLTGGAADGMSEIAVVAIPLCCPSER